MYSNNKGNISLKLVILFDIILFGVGLVIFALFHHVIPRAGDDGIEILNNAVLADEIEYEEIIESETDLEENINTDIDLNETEVTEEIDKFADKFTDGEIVQTENAYISDSINVTIDKIYDNGATYYIADIYVKDYTNFLSAFARDVYGKGYTDTTLNMAEDNEAIVAISGDYYGNGDDGLVIRNGILYRDDVLTDVLVMFDDGTMETYTENEFNIDELIEQGAYQGWSFGPMLLDNGEVITEFSVSSRLIDRNPRCGIGYYEPGHYCFIVIDGRQKGYSVGMTLPEFSELFYDLGCSVAYNMDGGRTAVMVFMGEVVNQPYKDGRSVSDIVYIK